MLGGESDSVTIDKGDDDDAEDDDGPACVDTAGPRNATLLQASACLPALVAPRLSSNATAPPSLVGGAPSPPSAAMLC